MPTRLLREGILDSEAVCTLSWLAEVFYRRLMSAVDDYGRFDSRVPVLKSRLYPLQADKVRDADIQRWLAECEKAGLLRTYVIDGKPYLLFHKLGTPRAAKSKFPAPSDEQHVTPVPNNNRLQPLTDENIGLQVKTGAPYSGSGSGSDSDSDSDSSADAGSISSICSEPVSPASKPTIPPPESVLEFPTVGKGGAKWFLTRQQIDAWQQTYPNMDVLAECRKARDWIEANPTKRKTPRGMPAFLVRWLGNATDRGRAAPLRPTPGAAPTSVDRTAERIGELMAQHAASKGNQS